MSELLVFQEFDSIEEAEKVLSILRAEGVLVFVEKTKGRLLDDNFIGAKYDPSLQLKMRGEDFSRAREILAEKYTVNLDELDSGYMLLSFTEKELMDVIAKPDEWGFYNYNVATALLKKKGIGVDALKKEELEKQRLIDLSHTKAISMFWILFGYFIPALNLFYFIFGYQAKLAVSGGWIFPGFGGLILGYVMSKALKTLPNGQRVPVYDKNTRMHGFLILRINLLFWVVNIVLFIINLITLL